MPSKARLTRIDRRLTPKKGPSWSFLRFLNDWRKPEGGETVLGPEGEVAAVPEGAKQVRIEYVRDWRGAKKAQEWPTSSVSADVTPADAPADQVLEDGTFVSPEPVLVPAPPLSWYVVRPSRYDLETIRVTQDFYYGADKQRRVDEVVSSMVRDAGATVPAESLGQFDDRGRALMFAREQLGEIYAAQREGLT